MKKASLFFLSLVLIVLLASWGFKGHRAVADIALKHLTSNTAYVVSAYLKGQSMADVSTLAFLKPAVRIEPCTICDGSTGQ